MAAACATLEEFLAVTGSVFSESGSTSTGTITVNAPSPGDSITLTKTNGRLPVAESWVADTDFVIGASDADTAANLATAISAGALANATSVGAVVYVESVSTGVVGELTLATSNTFRLAISGASLTGGAELIEFALETACLMVNLDQWRNKASMASIYLAAHLLALATGDGGGETGPVNRKKIDKIEVSNAATGLATGVDANFGSTKWGRAYLALRKTLMIFPLVGRSRLVW